MTPYSRRSLLARLGGAAAYLPILHARRGWAAPTAPKRLLVVAWPEGVMHRHFWPTGGETDFVIDETEQSPLKPLAPHKQDLVVVGGLELKAFQDLGRGGGHAAAPALLTGRRPAPANISTFDEIRATAAGPSVDMVVADAIAQRVKLPFHSLQVQTDFLKPDDRFISFRGGPVAGRPNAPTPENNVYRLFDKLFAGRMLPQAGAPTTLAPVRNHKKSVLDLVAAQLGRLAANLGTEDRQKIEQHLTSVREVERTLTSAPPTGVTGPGCRAVAPAGEKKDFTARNSMFMHEGQQLQADMVIAAMACDLTRVATLFWGDSANVGYVFWWLGSEFVQGRDRDNGGYDSGYRHHHEIAHSQSQDSARTRRKNLVDQWFFGQLAYILARLKSIREGEGTMLDNTLVCFLNVFSDGASHNTRDLPWVLAGRCGGAVKTGRYLRWASGQAGRLAPHNALLTEICNAMDVPTEHFGDPEYRASLRILRGA